MLKSILIDMNSFFASCEQQSDPKLRNKPIAVVPMVNVPTATVLASSVQAKRFGIKTGTLVGEAKRMCPQVQFVEAGHSSYVEYHDKIAEVIETVIPIDQVLSIDEFGCTLKGTQTIEENAIELANELKHRIETRVGECLTTSIGIAENMLIAKIASDLVKPNGLVVINAENRERILGPLSVRVIPGVGAQTEKKLNAYGFKTIQDLIRAKKEGITQAWGETLGSRYYDWLHGGHEARPYSQNKSLGHQHVLDPRYRNREAGVQIIKKLLVRAAARLRRKGFYAKNMSVHVRWVGNPGNDGNPNWDRSCRIEESNDPIVLLMHLEKMIQEMPDYKPLRVGICFTNLVPKDEHQFTLFENPKREFLLGSIDKINSRYGKNAITLASIHDIDAADSAKIAFTNIPDVEEF